MQSVSHGRKVKGALKDRRANMEMKKGLHDKCAGAYTAVGLRERETWTMIEGQKSRVSESSGNYIPQEYMSSNSNDVE